MSDEDRTPEPRREGPVPVRDLMRRMTPDAPADEGEPRSEEESVLGFERDGVEWRARVAGTGSYGTGRRGAARLVAVHFHTRDDPETPVREALVPAAAFPLLRPEELRELFERATPIDLDR